MDIAKSDKKIHHEGRFIRFVEREGWEFVERINCAGVVSIVSVTRDNKLLLVEQYRESMQSDVIELPGGLVSDNASNLGETVEEAAGRKLFEETGHHAEYVTEMNYGPVSSGLSTELVTFMQAHNPMKLPESGGAESELIVVHEAPLQNIGYWLSGQQDDGKLIDVKIYAGLYMLGKYFV